MSEHRAIGEIAEAGVPVAPEVSPTLLERRLSAAAERGGASLRERVRLALGELVGFAIEEPETVRALLAGGRGGGGAAAARREKTMDRLVACIEQTIGRYPPPGPSPSPLAAAAVVGGVERILQARLREDEEWSAEDLLPLLLHTAVLHLEGPVAAREALTESGDATEAGFEGGG